MSKFLKIVLCVVYAPLALPFVLFSKPEAKSDQKPSRGEAVPGCREPEAKCAPEDQGFGLFFLVLGFILVLAWAAS